MNMIHTIKLNPKFEDEFKYYIDSAKQLEEFEIYLNVIQDENVEVVEYFINEMGFHKDSFLEELQFIDYLQVSLQSQGGCGSGCGCSSEPSGCGCSSEPSGCGCSSEPSGCGCSSEPSGCGCSSEPSGCGCSSEPSGCSSEPSGCGCS